MKSHHLIFLAITALICTGCGSSFMTQSLTLADNKSSYSKILVVTKLRNEIARSLLEQDIVRELANHNINGVPYHKESGIGVPVDMELSDEERQDLEQRVKEEGYDGVIITNLVDVSQYRELIPPGLYPNTGPQNFGQFAFYWGFYRVYDIAPGTSIDRVRLEFESALYDLRRVDNNNLQWLGRFSLEDPTDIRKTTTKYAKELVNAMMKESISKG